MSRQTPHQPCPPRRPPAAEPVEEAQRAAGEAPPRPLHSIRLGGRTIPMPASRWVRIALGSALVLAGIAGFLPILGFWMVPLGLLILSIDLPLVRRWRRRTAVWFERNFPGVTARLRRWTTPSHLRGDSDRR
jgi:hypothetical protein